MKKKLTKKQIADVACVHSTDTELRLAGWPYRLRVADMPDVPSVDVFAPLDGIAFTNYRAAQDIANAIKAHVAKANDK